jgi:hypothetical protein
MPVTLFAHQVPTMGLKMARPTWFDGTALCIGSMTPDLAYSVSGYLGIDTHDWDGLLALDIPLAIVITCIVRWSTASVAAAHLPDLGAFRLWSWRVIHRRQPTWLLTVLCCALGALSHLVLDSFTHPGRLGVRTLGYDDITFQLWGRTEPLASVFQLIGHTFGALVGAWMLLIIGQRHLLERWYSVADVDHARHFRLDARARLVFWSVAGVGAAVGVWWGWRGGLVEGIQRPLVATMVAVMLAALLPACRPVPTETPVPARRVARPPEPR